jgi:hypothetical protein
MISTLFDLRGTGMSSRSRVATVGVYDERLSTPTLELLEDDFVWSNSSYGCR